jgi:uncharacterized protein DUF5681
MSGSNPAPVTSGTAVAALDDDAPQRGGRFKPGNPGRPKGARHKTTLAIEALLDGDTEALTRKAIELAKAGDLVALRLCLDRICPPRKERLLRLARAEHRGRCEACRVGAGEGGGRWRADPRRSIRTRASTGALWTRLWVSPPRPGLVSGSLRLHPATLQRAAVAAPDALTFSSG